MTESVIILLARDFFRLALQIAGPVLAVAIVLGVIVSVGQVLTSVQDATLAYVIRLAGVGAVVALLGRWMLSLMVRYMSELWRSIPDLIT